MKNDYLTSEDRLLFIDKKPQKIDKFFAAILLLAVGLIIVQIALKVA